ncbi:thiol reductant ABC exporter subunit CydD [Propionicicella superfundia]|uniref:thiol reductant ABC exporter subunit CydD n=1 Tax=Propionicicella superfundia TaxID=348582 RepID=UPI000A033076|nr:thiol reductant ABC exporter subunit CydD [Propionicicella superfundia]
MAGPIDPRLLRRARATKWYLAAGAGIGIATAVLTIGQAWLLARSLGGVFAVHTLDPVWPVLAPLAAVFAGKALLSWANTWLAQRASAAVKSQLRRDILRARLATPTASTTSTGSLITLLTTGLDALDGYFSKYLPQLVLAATVPALIVLAVGSADLASAVIIVVTLPLIPIFMALIGWTTEARTKRRWKVQQRLATHFFDLIAGLPTLQSFGRARAQRKGLAETEAAHRRETMGTLRVSFLSAFALELLATLSVAIVAVEVGFRVVYSDIDLTTAFFILILAPEAYLPVRQVGVHYHDSADGMAAADSAFAEIDRLTAMPRGTLAAPAVDASRVVFDGFAYRYPDAETDAVTGIDLTIEPGEIVALAGTSGVGKTTLLNALMGFVRPTAGRILVGDVDLAEIDPDAWRAQLAHVPQQPGMVRGSVGDNVLLGDTAATEARARAALDDAGGAGIPLDQPVGDDGEGLSAGERRRIATARAMLRVRSGARLLVLDEPTAGLDAEAERVLLASLRELGVGAVIVTHRPRVLAEVDRVVHLEDPVGAAV